MNRWMTGHGNPPACAAALLPLPRYRMATLAAGLVALGLAAAMAPVHAQVRNFPESALRGTLQVTAPPDVELDGKPDRLSPGARIRSPQNMLMLSGSLVGQPVVVNYVREPGGQIMDVWLLTAEEAAVKRPTAAGSSWLERLFGL